MLPLSTQLSGILNQHPGTDCTLLSGRFRIRLRELRPLRGPVWGGSGGMSPENLFEKLGRISSILPNSGYFNITTQDRITGFKTDAAGGCSIVNSWESGGAVSSVAGCGVEPRKIFESRVIFSSQ